MALVGACLSPNNRDRASSQVWLDAVEEMVLVINCSWTMTFRTYGKHLANIWQTSGSISARQPHLDILQVAYCVCVYQTWEGCK
jgi:hypothetical protein